MGTFVVLMLSQIEVHKLLITRLMCYFTLYGVTKQSCLFHRYCKEACCVLLSLRPSVNIILWREAVIDVIKRFIYIVICKSTMLLHTLFLFYTCLLNFLSVRLSKSFILTLIMQQTNTKPTCSQIKYVSNFWVCAEGFNHRLAYVLLYKTKPHND